MLNCELHTQISSRHEDLLAQTTGIESLESVLEVMTSRIASLKELINRISLRITEPFNKLKVCIGGTWFEQYLFFFQSRTVQLARLQDATDLLRRLIRLFYLTKRLRKVFNPWIWLVRTIVQSGSVWKPLEGNKCHLTRKKLQKLLKLWMNWIFSKMMVVV